jgi:hypothetical protein
VGELSLAQVCFKLAASRVQSRLVLMEFSSVFSDFSPVIADLLTVPKDLLFAGPVTNITPKLRSILSQLSIIPAQLLAAVLDFLARRANIFEVLLNFRLIMVATVVMTNVTAEVVIVMPAMMTFPTAVAEISSAMMAFPPIVAQISPTVKLPVTVALPEMLMAIAILSVGCRRDSGYD